MTLALEASSVTKGMSNFFNYPITLSTSDILTPEHNFAHAYKLASSPCFLSATSSMAPTSKSRSVQPASSLKAKSTSSATKIKKELLKSRKSGQYFVLQYDNHLQHLKK